MSYTEAMEAAGAEILAFQEFGSYQGDWWAKVRFNGEQGWIKGSYGSCSGCDAFEAEFSHIDKDECSEHRYEWPKPEHCDECDAAKADYQKKLAAFGLSYLTGGMMTQDEAERESLEYDWESEEYTRTKEGEQTDFVRKNAITGRHP